VMSAELGAILVHQNDFFQDSRQSVPTPWVPPL
jgi:hypothetical protein